MAWLSVLDYARRCIYISEKAGCAIQQNLSDVPSVRFQAYLRDDVNVLYNLALCRPVGSYRNVMGLYGLDSSVSRQGTVAGFCEHGNEPSGFVKYL
jgi:hypothetical protein